MNYNSLVDSIIDTQEDDGQEFVSAIPNFIDIAEETLTKALDTYGFQVRTSIALSAGSYLLTKPSDYRYPKAMWAFISGEAHPLYKRTDEYCRQYWPIRTSTAIIPKYYSDWDAQSYYIVPTPTSTLDMEFVYCVRPTALSSAHQTNWFTEQASDALFYKSMAEANRFAKNWLASKEWDQKFAEAVAIMTGLDDKTRRDDQQNNSSISGGDNTIGQRN